MNDKLHNKQICECTNNIAADNIGNNVPEPCDKCNPEPHCPPTKLWIIKYSVKDLGYAAEFIGQALVSAKTPKEAECIFGRDTRFNGFLDRLKVLDVQEIMPCQDSIMFNEEYTSIVNYRVLQTYPFVLKKDFLCTLEEFKLQTINAVVDAIEEIKHSVIVGVIRSAEGDGYIITDVQDEKLILTHADSGVTQGSYGESEDMTPSWGDSFTIVSTSVDSKGHLTSVEEHTVTLPSSVATSLTDGLMSKEDKAKLDTIEEGAEVNVQSDWNQTDTTADDYIKNKPNINTTNVDSLSPAIEPILNTINLHKISKTGDYNDLLNKPAINDGRLDIKYNVDWDDYDNEWRTTFRLGSFTANQATDTIINLPTIMWAYNEYPSWGQYADTKYISIPYDSLTNTLKLPLLKIKYENQSFTWFDTPQYDCFHPQDYYDLEPYTIQLAPVAKTGRFSDLLNIPEPWTLEIQYAFNRSSNYSNFVNFNLTDTGSNTTMIVVPLYDAKLNTYYGPTQVGYRVFSANADTDGYINFPILRYKGNILDINLNTTYPEIVIPDVLDDLTTGNAISKTNSQVEDTTISRLDVLYDNTTIGTNTNNQLEVIGKGEPNGFATLNGNGKVPEAQLPSYVDDVIEGYYIDGEFYTSEPTWDYEGYYDGDVSWTETETSEISDPSTPLPIVDGAKYKDLNTDEIYQYNGTTNEYTNITLDGLIEGESGKIYVDLNTNTTYRYAQTQYVNLSSPETPQLFTALTQAEYDALSAEDKANGSYLIKESTIPSLLDQIPNATINSRGLMSAEDKAKLDNIESSETVTIYASGNDYIYCWKWGNLVTVDLFIQDFTTSQSYTIPDGYRPRKTIFPCASSGTGGSTSINVALSSTGYITIGVQGTYVRLLCTYVI